MPIDMAMQHPWPRIVGDEADSRTIAELASGHGITYDRVGIVISATSSTSDDRKGVPMQVERMRAPCGSICVECNVNNLILRQSVYGAVG